MVKKGQSKTTNTDQTVLRNSKGRFKKGSMPKSGFDKNPKNIAPGGFWRYKEHGKAAIIDIFKMTMAEFNSLKKIKDDDKTVLDQMLFNKFESAMNGNSRDADFLLLQAFGYAPKYYEAKFDYQADFKPKKSPLDDLTVEELRVLIHD
ncbi:hypothetical protein IKG20_01160 [Candidatus Saccharibacteria bacterium]|nr:hypothetical protein [Candidatus Saccharibacteria bacterium]